MLTDEKREEIKVLLGKVNLSSICKELKVSRTTLWRTLHGKSEKFEELNAVVKEAKKAQKRKQKQLEKL